MRNAEAIGTVMAALLVIGLAVWFTSSIWSECRGYGHSWFYCVRMISR